MFFVYILKDTVTQQLYVGSCENLERRLSEHKLRRPTYKLIYQEIRGTRSEAFIREMFFKTGNGRRVLKGLLAKQST